MRTRNMKFAFCTALVGVGVPTLTLLAGVECMQWQPGSGVPGIAGTVNAATMWDPDGAGSQQAVLVVAGDFTLADSTIASNIAMWNGSSWSALGAGFNNAVNALTVYNGQLVAGGEFTASGATPLGRIARWNGSAWTRFNTGELVDFGGTVNALIVANGTLIAGTDTVTLGTNTTGFILPNHLAVWNGTQWGYINPSAATPGVDGPVYSLSLDSSGRLIVGGVYSSAAGDAGIQNISRWTWNGSTDWTPAALGTTLDATVTTVLPIGNDVIACGWFSTPAGYVARWNDAAGTWSDMGIGFDTPPTELLMLPGGDILAGGAFAAIGGIGVPGRMLSPGLARWDGSAWSPVWSEEADGPRAVGALLAKSNGDIVVGGNFRSAGEGVPADGVALWSGSTWSAITSGSASTSGEVAALYTTSTGDVLAGGRFQTIGGVSARRVAKWNGANWSPLGQGLYGATEPWPFTLDIVGALLETSGGGIVAGGSDFAVTAGGARSIVARFDGSSWTNYPSSILPGPVYPSFLGLPDLGSVECMTEFQGGIVAGSNPSFLTGDDVTLRYFVRWNGTSWEDLGSLSQDIARAMVVLPDDGLPGANELVVGGAALMDSVAGARGIARWDGVSYLGNDAPDWTPLGQGVSSGDFNGGVNAILLLPNGDLIVGGFFNGAGNTVAGDVPANNIARWNRATSTWTALANGLNSNVNALALLSNGDIIAGGEFTAAGNAADGDTPVNYLARWDGSAWSALGDGVNGRVQTLAVAGNGDLLVGGRFTIAGGQASAYLARWACQGNACAADFNGVNGVTVQDIFDFLTAWLAGNSSADFNHVNGVTVQDIFDFLTAWLAGC